MYPIDHMRLEETAFPVSRVPGDPSVNKEDAIRVLLIEDNLTDAQLLKRVLQKSKSPIPIQIAHEASVAAALRHIGDQEVDVMLIDFSLPDSLGLETFKMLRARFPNIPIIILTGNDSDDLAIKTLKIGAQDYITKHELDGRLLIRSLRYAVERQRLQIELNFAHKRQLLSQKLESLGLIAGGVAHDFNNLLGAISGNAELAELKSSHNPQIKGFLQNITAACKRGGELCNQLMAYSGKGYLDLTVCDLNELIQELLPLIGVSLNKQSEVHYHLMAHPPTVEADSTQIQQIIMNLLTNASDALEDKVGTIHVETGVFRLDPIFMQGYFWGASTIKEWHEYNYVKVEDNGIGMSSETIAKIFDPFFTTKFSGRGLGLAAVLGIVQAHNGALKVSSKVGEGSSFWFLLPTSNQPKKQKKFVKTATQRWQGHGTILIADDESDLRDALDNYLQCIGFTTILAADGLQAVEQFEQHKETLSAVLLDMTMPKLNGKDIYGHITNKMPDMKVLLMSGYTEKKIESEFDLGASLAFIKKPFRLQELNEALQKLLAD